jgi:hypothetical protein
MDEEQVMEASWAAQIVIGFSAYLYGIGYSLEQWHQELEAMGEHIEKSAQA